jgi:hypothetical protein
MNKIISITSEMISNLIKDGVVAIGEKKTWHPSFRSWNSLDLLRRRNGHVPRRSTNLLNHADRMLAQPRLPETSESKFKNSLTASHQR